MLVRCQLFGDLFLFGLVWQYSLIQKNIMKVGSKPRLLTSFSNITLSLPSLYFSESKRELNFCNGYLSLLYFWGQPRHSRENQTGPNGTGPILERVIVQDNSQMQPTINQQKIRSKQNQLFTE